MIHQEFFVEARHADQTGVLWTSRARADGVRVPRISVLDRCRYCRTQFRAHPGFADHQDQCELNPMNRPHIIGTANATGIDRAVNTGTEQSGGDVRGE